MGERTLLWDMSILHPGLQMKVGPSLSGGLLEFVLDPSNQYDDRSHNHYEEFTGESEVKTSKKLKDSLTSRCDN